MFLNRRNFENKTDIPLPHGNIVHPLAANQDVAAGRHFEPGNHAQHRRLAAAAGAEQRHEFAFLDGESDVANGLHFAELLGNVSQLDAHSTRGGSVLSLGFFVISSLPPFEQGFDPRVHKASSARRLATAKAPALSYSL